MISISSGPLTAKFNQLGATLTHLLFRKKDGTELDLVLGFDDPEMYKSDLNRYFGCIVGRCCNRIANGQFDLNGKEYQIYVNNGPNHLHGGKKGFDQQQWKIIEQTSDSVTFYYQSLDGEEMYPGTVDCQVQYRLTSDNQLEILYEAVNISKESTIVNLTNHTYWNLNAQNSVFENHLFHFPQVEFVLEMTNQLPSGKILKVEGETEFKEAKKIKMNYDHCFVLNNQPNSEPKLGAVVYSPSSHVELKFSTTEPGFQFYTGEYISRIDHPKSSHSHYDKTFGFCLEAQRFPDAIHHWPEQVILKSGQKYSQKTIYQITERKE